MNAERLLYRIGLGSAAIVETSFDVECARFDGAAQLIDMQPPLFVCGLARAGTTVLTRAFHASDAFATSTYRDLPFPLAPNAWRQMSRPFRRDVARVERGHGDGIFHDLDSPEAIEEVFWRHFCGRRYIKPSALVPHVPPQDVLHKYGQFMRLVALACGRGRYLAKNNNNVLRLPTLLTTFKKAIAIIPFRNPIAQAGSLLHQHQRSSELHKNDPFRGRFMHWLGHHEFGSDQRPFVLASSPQSRDPNIIDYWVQLWTEVYGYLKLLALKHPDQIILADYDLLCRNPVLLRRLFERVGCSVGQLSDDDLAVQQDRRVPAPSAHLGAAAGKLHVELQQLAAGTRS